MTDTPQLLLAHHLKALKLPTYALFAVKPLACGAPLRGFGA